MEEAKTTLLQALDLEDRLAGEHPEVRAYRESLATILLYFAGLQEDKLHDIPGGIASHQRAAEIMEKACSGSPRGDQVPIVSWLYPCNSRACLRRRERVIPSG